MGKSKKITESLQFQGSPYGLWNSTGFDYNAFNYQQNWLNGSWNGSAFGVNPWSTQWMFDNGSGYLRPVYLTNMQLKQVREKARILAYYNEIATAVVNLYQNYVCGDGFAWKIIGKNDSVNKRLVEQGQDLIDIYCEHNEIDKMINEYVWRLLVEGEACIRHFPQPDGIITTRWVENDLLLPPADTNDPDMSFGIECSKDDMHDVIGYWIVEKPYLGNTPVFVPKEEVSYDKVGTLSNTKRGLSLFFPIYENLTQSERVLGSMISLAISRSKVSMIRKVTNASPEGVNKLIQNTASAQVNNSMYNPGANNQLNIENLPDSTILTSSANVEYEFPDIQLGSVDSEITFLANLRVICGHMGISEQQLTQKLEGGSYASHLVQESPSFKTFSRWQKRIGDFFATKRTSPNTSLMWKQIQYAVKKGLLPQNALTDLKITYTAPSLLTRDPKEEAETSKIWVDMGIKSPQTIAGEQGVDFEEQQLQRSNDYSFSTIMQSVRQLKESGVMGDAAKKVLKYYHPNVPEEVLNALFEEQENNNDEKTENQNKQ